MKILTFILNRLFKITLVIILLPSIAPILFFIVLFGEYIVTILRIVQFIIFLPVIIIGLLIAQILAWFKI